MRAEYQCHGISIDQSEHSIYLYECLKALLNLTKLRHLLNDSIQITDGGKILETDVIENEERQCQLKHSGWFLT